MTELNSNIIGVGVYLQYKVLYSANKRTLANPAAHSRSKKFCSVLSESKTLGLRATITSGKMRLRFGTNSPQYIYLILTNCFTKFVAES